MEFAIAGIIFKKLIITIIIYFLDNRTKLINTLTVTLWIWSDRS